MNMFRELKTDLNYSIPDNGCLTPWADQGMLLLNAVLTVRAGVLNSHKNHSGRRNSPTRPSWPSAKGPSRWCSHCGC